MGFSELMQALQDSQFAATVRGGAMLYPWINTLHVLAIALFVGTTVAFDARLLGFGKAVSADGLSALLMPFMVSGLILAILSGIALFASDAVSLSGNRLLVTKLILVSVGIANALTFRKLWNRHLKRWDIDAPFAGKAQALASIAIWLSVASLGRLIAYF